jgi:flagellar biosynthesis GTPase FlhF
MYPMNYLRILQLRRAAGDGGGTATDATGEKTEAEDDAKEKTDGTEKPDGEKSFTQEDVTRIINQTIAKERAKAEKAVANAKTEAEKLATMTAEEKAAHEQKEREDKLAAREAEINKRELRATALQTLAEKKLPAELVDVIDLADADKCSASIASVEKVFRAAVQKGVDERLKGNPPPAGGATGTQAVQTGLAGAIKAHYDKTKG